MHIAVLSGKGGTGKTTLVAAFCRLANRVVAVECDVDAANLALLLPGSDRTSTPFTSGRRARVDPDACAGCGICAEVCRFQAIEEGPDGDIRIREIACEGCGACALVCPAGAVSFEPNRAGTWNVRRLGNGWLVHAHLGVAQDNSGRLVAHVRGEADRIAAERGVELVLCDGPPGIGCPVHATIGHQDQVLAVAEPSASGASDLERLIDVAGHFEVPVVVVINKWDLAPEVAAAIERRCAERGVQVVGKIPFDPAIPRMLALGRVPLESPARTETRAAIRAVWESLTTRDP